MLRTLYKKSPIFIQNIFVTVANTKVLYKKYRYIPLLNPMEKVVSDVMRTTQTNNKETLLQRLNEFLTYATTHSSYYLHYKNKYPTLHQLNEIKELPLLQKSVLREDITSFYSDESTLLNTALLHTSGTTGSPMEIKVSISDLQLRFRLLLKTMVEFGYNPQKPLARISGEDIADAKNIYRKDHLNRHIFLSAFHLCEESVHRYYNAIIDNKVEALEGYPSLIYTMAKLFELHHLKVTSITHVFTTAEKLHAYQKETIESVFTCKVFDYYGSNDQSVFIFTCKNGRLHSTDTTGLLEVLDHNGRTAKPGHTGRMVVTSFTSHFMPLIRYEIGDQCIVSTNQECSCGNGGTILEEIVGRDEDIFKTYDGLYITRFSVVLKQLPSTVIESQLLLSHSHLNIVLYYSAFHEIPEHEFVPFKEALFKKVGHRYQLQIVKVTEIPISAKGKKKAVIIED